MNPLLNFVFQEQLVPHIFPNGMELSTLDQIVNVLSGTTEHFSGLCCIDHPVGNEAAEIIKRERYFCSSTIQDSIVYHSLFAPADAIAIRLHRNGTEDIFAQLR